MGKVPPAGCKWRERTYNPFVEFSANFGVQLGHKDLIIDVDPRNGGTNSLLKLVADIGCSLPEGPSVVTGSGGQHIYLEKPIKLKIKKGLKAYPGIDFLSDGCYVVGAGSIHPETNKEYLLCPGPAVKAPQKLLELIEKTDTPLKTKPEAREYVNDAQTKERYIDYLKSAPIAIEGEAGDATTFSVAATGRDFGLSPDITYDLILQFYNGRCQPPWDPDPLRRKIDNAFHYASGNVGSRAPDIAFPKQEFEVWDPEQDKFFHKNAFNQIKLDQHNTALMFAPDFPLAGLLALDLFSHNLIYKKRAPWHNPKEDIRVWTDDEASRCRHWLSTNKKYEPNQQMMHDGALVAAYQYQFHPVKDYFESLVWDGHKRIHNWMHSYLGAAEDPYTRAVGLKTLVACVKRIYEPGCKFDYITVLEGHQDTGKSTAWKILAGKQWFGDTPIDISKEWSIMKTFGKLMYEWAEMETFRKSGTQAMKAFLSSESDTVRLPYNRNIQNIPRQGIFVGTFNPDKDADIGWLHDTTGNRRYWVVSTSVCGDIRNDKLEAVRDQLWAEAIALYRMGVPIYFEDIVVIKMAQDEQAKRLGKDPWHDAIDMWVNAEHNLDKIVLTGDEIFKDCIGGNLTQYKRVEMGRISMVMVKLGWAKGVHHHAVRKESVRGFKRPLPRELE